MTTTDDADDNADDDYAFDYDEEEELLSINRDFNSKGSEFYFCFHFRYLFGS
mgnify:CR=1 FL=1